jgi:hypothetical protein
MRRITRRLNAWARAQPRRASIAAGITAGLLLFAMATIATHDLIWGMLSGLSTGIATGVALYSSVTWERGS